jgi:hypothetical protein
MRIIPSVVSISALFIGNKNEQFIIPAYQRRYAWNIKQVTELFNDLNRLDDEDTHILGAILTLTDEHTGNLNKLEVVDGQQRLISITLLLKAIQNRFIEIKKEKDAEDIEDYFYCKGAHDREERDKILLGDLDRPDYLRLIKKENLDEIKNQKLLKAYDEFKSCLSSFDYDKLNVFYGKLINRCQIIRLDTNKAKDAYRLFETVNNRGLRLSETDKIKSFLLGHASIINSDTLEKVKLNWRELIVTLDGLDTDDFFRVFLCSLLRKKVTFNALLHDFKKHYVVSVKDIDKLPTYYSAQTNQKDDDNNTNKLEDSDENQKKVITVKEKESIIEFSKSLKETSNIYYKIVNSKFDNRKINYHLTNLQKIKSLPTNIFLLNLFDRQISDANKIDILKILETFMLRRNICKYQTGELDAIFSNLVRVEDKDIVDNIRKKLSKDLPNDDKFEEELKQADFRRNTDRAKYMLEQFNYNSTGDQGEYSINSGNEVHLEHIIPQTITTKKSKGKYGDWVTYLGKNSIDKHKDYVDRIGNYTLLGQILNIKASNNPFLSKKKEYKKSTLQLTKDLVRDYNSFKFNSIDKRSKEFAKLAPKIWKF